MPAWLSNLVILYGFGISWSGSGGHWYIFTERERAGGQCVTVTPQDTLPSIVAALKRRGITHATRDATDSS